MSLTLKQKREIGRIRLDWCFLVNSRGHPLGVFPKGRLPYLEEVKEMIFDKLKEDGGYQVKRIRPADANCVVRVYNNLEYVHGEENYCLLGAICYTKAHGQNKWVSYDKEGNEEVLDYENCKVAVEFSNGVEFACAEFFDTYVKVFK